MLHFIPINYIFFIKITLVVVILELLKGRLNLGLPANFYFWRDQTGHEIDFIAEWGGVVKAIEIKSNSTFQPAFIKNLKFFQNLAVNSESYLVYNGTQEGIFDNTNLIPLKKIKQLLN